MSSHKHATKVALVLALALGAIAPAAALARPYLSGPDRSSPASSINAKSTVTNMYGNRLATPSSTPSQRPTVQIVRVSAPGGFSWGDAGIGVAAALGLVMLGVGGKSVMVGKRRRAPATLGTGHSAIPR